MSLLIEHSPPNNEVNSLLPIDEDIKKEDVKIENEIAKKENNQEKNFGFEDPATVQTKHSFATSPWTKLLFIGGTFGIGFLIVFLVLNNLSNTNVVAKKTETSTKTFTDIKPPKDNLGDKAIGRVALIEQKNELEALNKQEEGRKSNLTLEKQKSLQKRKNYQTTSPRKFSNSVDVPRRSYSQDTLATRDTNSRYSTPTRAKNSYSSVPTSRPNKRVRYNSSQLNSGASFPPPPPEFNNQLSPATASSAIAEIDRLRTLGSIGQVEYKISKVTTANSTQTTRANVEELTSEDPTGNIEQRRRPAGTSNSYRARDATFTSNTVEELVPRWEPVQEKSRPSSIDDDVSNSTVNSSTSASNPPLLIKPEKIASTNDGVIHDFLVKRDRALGNFDNEKKLEGGGTLDEEKLILEESQPQYLVVGSFAKATLVTPLLVSQSTNRDSKEADTLRFVATLDEPLYSNTGEVAINAKTQLIIAVSSISSSSRINAEVVGIIMNKTEYPISPGVISVLGQEGGPLVASPFDNKGNEIARYDTSLGIFAGLAKIGEIINQPDEEIISDNLETGVTTTRSSNANRSIEGAFIEGLFGSLNDNVSKRTNTAVKEISDRPVDWYVPKNTKIIIEVNKSIKL